MTARGASGWRPCGSAGWAEDGGFWDSNGSVASAPASSIRPVEAAPESTTSTSIVDQANGGSFLIFYCAVSGRELKAHRLVANTRSVHQFAGPLNIRILVDDVGVAFEQTSRLCNLR